MSVDDEIRKTVDAAVAQALPGAIRDAFGAMFSGDRRAEPWKKKRGGKRKRGKAAGKRPKQTCKAPGCKNPFAPRYGGWCPKHHGTAGFKTWQAGRKKR